MIINLTGKGKNDRLRVHKIKIMKWMH